MYICTPQVFLVPIEAKDDIRLSRTSYKLLGYHVGAVNQTKALWKSGKYTIDQ